MVTICYHFLFLYMKTFLEYIQKKQITEINYVDLCLPSGTKWATMNIGAKEGDKPEDWYGLYFTWGETQGYTALDKHDFSWDNYKFVIKDNVSYMFGKRDNLSKYNNEDKLTQLEKEDDVVYQITNGKFRMPTDKELEELYKNTDNNWVENYKNINDLNGRLFVSKKDKTKSIFIPASGYRDDFYFTSGTNLYLWSSILFSARTNNSCSLGTDTDNIDIFYSNRCTGFAIRGVLNK